MPASRDSLLKHIQWRLVVRKFCVVSEKELNRAWPIEGKNVAQRVEAIHAFAKANDLSAVIQKSGLRATFRKVKART
jgi:hypothetical protein